MTAARSVATSIVVITLGVTTHRIPVASTAAASDSSAGSMTSVAAIDRYSSATPTTDDSWPRSASIRSAGPFRAAPPTIGDTATTDSRRSASSSSTPRNARIGPIDTIGFDGAITTTSAVSIAARAGADSVASSWSNRTGPDLDVVAQPDEVVLEADLAVAGDGHHRAQPIVGHRQQRDAETPCPSDLGGHLGERGALAEAGRAVQVRRQVAVAEVEPRRRRDGPWRPDLGVPIEGRHRVPCLAGEPPAALGIDRLGERVRDRVEVGGDVQAVELGVVAGVDDGGDLAGVDHPDDAPQQTCRTDTAGDHRHRCPDGHVPAVHDASAMARR